MRRSRIVAVVAALGAAPLAHAQTTDAAGMARHAAANQLGVLEFCQGRGDVGADTVGAQRAVIGHLPASGVATDGDESLGRKGTLAAPNGQTMTLADVAAQHGTTVSAFCKQLGDSAVRSAGMYAGGGMPQMPAGMPQLPAGMPGGMQMPAMPGGMPAMSGMPRAPGSSQ